MKSTTLHFPLKIAGSDVDSDVETINNIHRILRQTSPSVSIKLKVFGQKEKLHM